MSRLAAVYFSKKIISSLFITSAILMGAQILTYLCSMMYAGVILERKLKEDDSKAMNVSIF